MQLALTHRLWTAHLLQDFTPPWAGTRTVKPMVWLGFVEAVGTIVSLAATEITRRRVDTNRSALVGRVLMVNAALIVAALAAFGLTRIF